ncbi:unnamed protein product, partial [Mesorhabditis spiculigera]
MFTVSIDYLDRRRPPQHIDVAAQVEAVTLLEQDSDAALHLQAMFQKYLAEEYGPEIDTMCFRCAPPNADVVLMTRRHRVRRRGARLYDEARHDELDHVTMSITNFPASRSESCEALLPRRVYAIPNRPYSFPDISKPVAGFYRVLASCAYDRLDVL